MAETKVEKTEVVEKEPGKFEKWWKKNWKKAVGIAAGVAAMAASYGFGYVKGSGSELYLESGSGDSIDMEVHDDGSFAVSETKED